MKKILLPCFLLIVNCCFSQIKELTKTIYFSSNEFTLTNESKQVLDTIKNQITGRKIVNYSIEGFTDDIGSGLSNEVLSYKRAGSVEKWLEQKVDNGVVYFSKGNLIATGEDNPVNKNSTEEERAVNRKAIVKIQVDYTPIIPLSTIKKLSNESSLQSYCINNNSDTLLVCKKGTMLYIKANSFKNAQLSNCITIKVRESFSTFDALQNDLTTYNNNNILYSESMIEVEAEQNDKKISLAPQRDFVVFSPTTQNVSTASLYNGESINNQINWVLTNNTLNQINANQLTLCNGQSFRNCLQVNNEYCHKKPLFFFGLGKMVTAPFKQSGVSQWRNYNRCRKSHKKIKVTAPATNNYDATYASTMSALQDKISYAKCYTGEAGPCGLLVNKMDLQCNIIWQNKIQQSLDSMSKNGTMLSVESLNSLQHVVFNRNNLGWSNIDWMLGVPESNRKDIYVNLEATKYTEAKIIFKNFKTILKAIADNNGNLYFPQMPINEPASILLLDTRTGTEKILAQKIDITTASQTIQPNLNAFTTNHYIKLLEGFK